MNNDGSTPENVEYLRRCEVCGEAFLAARRNSRCCRRHECHAAVAEFWDFSALHFILKNAHWAGAPSQEEMRAKYYEWQVRDAIEQLPLSADPLAEALIEILAELSAGTPECPAERV
jgi:hypothetical protein